MKALETSTLRLVAYILACAAAVMICAKLATVYHIPLPVWLIAGLAIGTAFHEAGHALCAAITGIPVRRVVIGAGPLLVNHSVWGVRLELRLIPFGGAVYHDSPFPHRKLAIAFVTLGGILGNIAFVSIVAALAAVGAVPSEAESPLSVMVVAQFLLIALSLAPFKARVGKARVATDGLQLLALMFWPLYGARHQKRYYDAQVGRYRGPASLQSSPSPAGTRIIPETMRLDGWSDRTVRLEILKTLADELKRGGLQREEEMLVLDHLLTYGLVCGDQEFRPHLEEWSARAVQLGPEIATLVATRGGVLVELGHYEAGKALLSPLLAKKRGQSADAKFDTFMMQYSLARAERALGNAVAAEALATAARSTAGTIAESAAVQVIMQRLDTELV